MSSQKQLIEKSQSGRKRRKKSRNKAGVETRKMARDGSLFTLHDVERKPSYA